MALPAAAATATAAANLLRLRRRGLNFRRRWEWNIGVGRRSSLLYRRVREAVPAAGCSQAHQALHMPPGAPRPPHR